MCTTNPHNTQAWKVREIGPKEILLYIDPTRILPQTDPPARQIHIGVGLLLETFRIAATSIGHVANIELFPEGESPREDLGRSPVARIRLVQDSIVLDPLFEQIPRRRTSRLPYAPGSFTTEEFQTLLAEAGSTHTKVSAHFGAELAGLLPLCKKGMEVECRTRRTYEESRIWFRVHEERIERLRDGITFEGNGITGLRKWIAALYIGEAREDRWHTKSSIDKYLSDFSEVLVATPGLVTLVSPSSGRKDQILTGMDLCRFGLAAAKRDIWLHPVSQTLQEFPEMASLRTETFDKLGVQGEATPQMILRAGKSHEPWKSWRRFPKDLIQA